MTDPYQTVGPDQYIVTHQYNALGQQTNVTDGLMSTTNWFNNQGLQVATGANVMFLNNDISADAGWLDPCLPGHLRHQLADAPPPGAGVGFRPARAVRIERRGRGAGGEKPAFGVEEGCLGARAAQVQAQEQRRRGQEAQPPRAARTKAPARDGSTWFQV